MAKRIKSQSSTGKGENFDNDIIDKFSKTEILAKNVFFLKDANPELYKTLIKDKQIMTKILSERDLDEVSIEEKDMTLEVLEDMHPQAEISWSSYHNLVRKANKDKLLYNQLNYLNKNVEKLKDLPNEDNIISLANFDQKHADLHTEIGKRVENIIDASKNKLTQNAYSKILEEPELAKMEIAKQQFDASKIINLELSRLENTINSLYDLRSSAEQVSKTEVIDYYGREIEKIETLRNKLEITRNNIAENATSFFESQKGKAQIEKEEEQKEKEIAKDQKTKKLETSLYEKNSRDIEEEENLSEKTKNSTFWEHFNSGPDLAKKQHEINQKSNKEHFLFYGAKFRESLIERDKIKNAIGEEEYEKANNMKPLLEAEIDYYHKKMKSYSPQGYQSKKEQKNYLNQSEISKSAAETKIGLYAANDIAKGMEDIGSNLTNLRRKA